MKLKHSLYFFSLFAFPLAAEAQYFPYADDALKFTQQSLGGTARYKALGGAQTSLGGDLGSLSGNPAGVGMFRRSDISASMVYNNTQITGSNFLGSADQKEGKGSFKLNNFGIVLPLYMNHDKLNEISNEWVGVNIGVGYNQTNNFNSRLVVSGRNTQNSITQFYAEDLGNIGDIAYLDTHLLDKDTGAPITMGNVDQYYDFASKGRQDETNIVLGANYGNKLFLGATLTLTDQDYNDSRQFTESGIASGPLNAFDIERLSQIENLSVQGTGISGKIGAIYRPIEEFRFGGSLTFPTRWEMQEDYNFDSNSTSRNGTFYQPAVEDLEPQTFDYTLTTPFKYNVGASYFYKKLGFLTADVEFIDYSTLDFDSNDAAANRAVREDIKDLYTSAINVNVGAEVKLNDNFSLRGGYGYQGSPYKNDNLGYNSARNHFTGGVGYRINNLYIDAAYVNSTAKSTQYPYTFGDNVGPWVDTKSRSNAVSLTVGTRF